MSKEYDPLFDPNFIGYNCKDPEESEDFGVIEENEEYAEEYFAAIFDSLPEGVKSKARESGLLNAPDRTDQEFRPWMRASCDFFKKNGVKWIFVRENLPVEDIDSQFFYVSLPEEKIVCLFDYLFDDEEIKIAVYMTKGPNKCKPKMFAVPDDLEEEGEFEDEASFEDNEKIDEDGFFEDRSDATSYWEDAWEGSSRNRVIP